MLNYHLMVRILVPIDFSPAAANAVAYALQFSKVLNAEVVCLHACEDVSTQHAAQFQLEEFMAQYAPGTAARGLCINGSIEKAVNEFTAAEHTDLIIMGTKGAAGFQKVLGGSHTTDLLSSVPLPLLIVPEGYHYKPIKFAMLASDFHTASFSKALFTLADIAHAYDAEVRIAHVRLPGDHSSTTQDFRISRELHLLREDGVKYSLKKISWTDIVGGIKYYLELKGDNDLLVMIRKKHGFLDRLFRRDHAFEFACDPTLPLLMVQE